MSCMKMSERQQWIISREVCAFLLSYAQRHVYASCMYAPSSGINGGKGMHASAWACRAVIEKVQMSTARIRFDSCCSQW